MEELISYISSTKPIIRELNPPIRIEIISLKFVSKKNIIGIEKHINVIPNTIPPPLGTWPSWSDLVFSIENIFLDSLY